LPGPYLLTRTMWMECISDRAYESRESLADAIVRILREELLALLAAGAALVQFDEPVLTEVVFGQAARQRTFMCGALGEKRPLAEELEFAGQLLRRVTDGVEPARTALHICRGNWTRDESVALSGSYEPLLPLLETTEIGTFFLECCTPRAGELKVLASLPQNRRIGVGVVNQKLNHVESVDQVVRQAETAIDVFGPHRVLLNPDCGFATFADNPLASAEIATAKLAAIAQAASILKRRY
jgi:5-methyltetrahydropteroyltriglutamate--homocysteine methyltransferase